MAEALNSKGQGGARRGSFSPGAIWPPVIWFALIWVVSSLPGKHLPTHQVLGLDKLAHIGVYLILGLLTNRAARLKGFSLKTIWWVYLLLLVTAGLDELHQHFIPQRSVSVWDFAANAFGLVLAFGAGWIKRDKS